MRHVGQVRKRGRHAPGPVPERSAHRNVLRETGLLGVLLGLAILHHDHSSLTFVNQAILVEVHLFFHLGENFIALLNGINLVVKINNVLLGSIIDSAKIAYKVLVEFHVHKSEDVTAGSDHSE